MLDGLSVAERWLEGEQLSHVTIAHPLANGHHERVSLLLERKASAIFAIRGPLEIVGRAQSLHGQVFWSGRLDAESRSFDFLLLIQRVLEEHRTERRHSPTPSALESRTASTFHLRS